MANSFLSARSIILLMAAFVNAGYDSSADKNLQALEAEVMKSGAEEFLDAGRAKFLGLQAGTPERVKELLVDEDTSDGYTHGVELVLDAKKRKARNVLLRVASMKEETLESFYFKLSPRGDVERIVMTRVTTRDGKAVRGSGKSELTSIDAPGVREKLQHELDFWLKGMYRKPPPVAAPPK